MTKSGFYLYYLLWVWLWLGVNACAVSWHMRV